jgi:hypothetical protein
VPLTPFSLRGLPDRALLEALRALARRDPDLEADPLVHLFSESVAYHRITAPPADPGCGALGRAAPLGGSVAGAASHAREPARPPGAGAHRSKRAIGGAAGGRAERNCPRGEFNCPRGEFRPAAPAAEAARRAALPGDLHRGSRDVREAHGGPGAAAPPDPGRRPRPALRPRARSVGARGAPNQVRGERAAAEHWSGGEGPGRTGDPPHPGRDQARRREARSRSLQLRGSQRPPLWLTGIARVPPRTAVRSHAASPRRRDHSPLPCPQPPRGDPRLRRSSHCALPETGARPTQLAPGRVRRPE